MDDRPKVVRFEAYFVFFPSGPPGFVCPAASSDTLKATDWATEAMADAIFGCLLLPETLVQWRDWNIRGGAQDNTSDHTGKFSDGESWRIGLVYLAFEVPFLSIGVFGRVDAILINLILGHSSENHSCCMDE